MLKKKPVILSTKLNRTGGNRQKILSCVCRGVFNVYVFNCTCVLYLRRIRKSSSKYLEIFTLSSICKRLEYRTKVLKCKSTSNATIFSALWKDPLFLERRFFSITFISRLFLSLVIKINIMLHKVQRLYDTDIRLLFVKKAKDSVLLLLSDSAVICLIIQTQSKVSNYNNKKCLYRNFNSYWRAVLCVRRSVNMQLLISCIFTDSKYNWQ